MTRRKPRHIPLEPDGDVYIHPSDGLGEFRDLKYKKCKKPLNKAQLTLERVKERIYCEN